MYESLKVAPTLYYVLNFTHTDVKTETKHIFYIESCVHYSCSFLQRLF